MIGYGTPATQKFYEIGRRPTWRIRHDSPYVFIGVLLAANNLKLAGSFPEVSPAGIRDISAPESTK